MMRYYRDAKRWARFDNWPPELRKQLRDDMDHDYARKDRTALEDCAEALERKAKRDVLHGEKEPK